MAGKPKTIWSEEVINHLRDNYRADLERGLLFHTTDNGRHWSAGDLQVTHVDSHGYVGFNITLPSKKHMRLKVHQVIWFFKTGRQSLATLLDHKDRNRQNNAADNIREGTDQDNQSNRSDNTYTGEYRVSFDKRRCKYYLYIITVGGIGAKGRKYIKSFDTEADAILYTKLNKI